MSLQLSGTSGVLDNSGAFIAGTAVASTSGTSIDFTSIPSWVKRITVMFNGVSTNGTSVPIVQLGTSGGIETSGYASVGTGLGATSMATTDYTTGFGLEDGGNASYAITGNLILNLISTNTWVGSGTARRATQNGCCFSGSKTTASTLDRVRITTVNGTDTFDAGSINILYE